MAYMPGLRKLACRYRHRAEDRADLVTDTIIYALGAWQNFREDGGMWNWLRFCMRGVVSNGAKKAAARRSLMRFVPLERGMEDMQSVEPSQHHHLELSETVGRLRRIRGGNLVIRRALGDQYREISARNGMAISRIEKTSDAARKKLLRAA
jgi:DNA-directed RNA polymerase specialized sigma24 family protein